jgi:hypothetical protein
MAKIEGVWPAAIHVRGPTLSSDVMVTNSAARWFTLVLLLGLPRSGLVACAGGGQLAGKSDWSTLYTGQGTVPARLVNESGEAITVRVQDDQGNVVAQAPLPPHEAETVKLPTGSVRVTVRVERDGLSSYTEPQAFEVSRGKRLEWPFSPPPMQ